MDIFKYVETLDNNIAAVARVNLKRHHKYLFVAGVIGAVLYQQNREIKELKNQLRNFGHKLQLTQQEFFDKTFMSKEPAAEEVTPEQ